MIESRNFVEIMTSANRTFVVQACIGDVPTLAKVSADSFLDDRHTQMKSQGAKAYDHESSMKEHLPRQIESPNSVLLKAVDASSGKIAGWVSWGFRGFDTEEITRIRHELEESALKYQSASSLEVKPATTEISDQRAGPEISTPKNAKVQELENLTSADLQSWMERFMPPGTKCMFVISLCVAPEWQSMGIGSSLLKWGTQKADIAGVFIWVHSSEGAWKMYHKHGFEVVGSLCVDLDQYSSTGAVDQEGKLERWGYYTFRYMRRLPQN